MENIVDNPATVAEPAVVAQCGGAEDVLNFAGEVIVNGVRLPLMVIEQLRQAGIGAIGWLTGSELQDAVDACKVDGNLIDDPHGLTLRDKMTLTPAEQQARRPKRKKPKTYEEMILAERDKKEQEMEEESSYLLAL